jgi:hypothetical protein
MKAQDKVNEQWFHASCVGPSLILFCNFKIAHFDNYDTNITIIDFFSVALQSVEDLGHLTYRRFLELFRHGRTPWTSDQPVAGPLPTHDNTTQKDADKHPCLEIIDIPNVIIRMYQSEECN